MNFKIEMNYLNIDNYPSLEKHFEKMANKGWLIDKVYMGSLFIYKKIEPQALDFSISPYEVETAFTRKTKKDLEEFQTVSEMVGWNYATKSYDLHIYYKSKSSAAVPIHTDEEEEFKLLERIAKRYLKVQYFFLPLLLVLNWLIIGSIFSNIRAMKDGFIQIVAIALPIAVLMSVVHITDLRKFLRKNRENIEQGKPLAFNFSNQWLYKISYWIFYLVILGVIVYLFYTAIFLHDLLAITRLMPLVVGGIIGLMYRAWIKPLRKGLGFKLGSFLVTLVVAGLMGIPLGWVSFSILTNNQGIRDPNEFEVLIADDFVEEEIEEWGTLERNTSILIPASHTYTSHYEEDIIETEYSRALTESFAENLVERYFQQASNRFRGRYGREVDQAFSDGKYHPGLEASGFTEEDFNQMYEEGAGIELYRIWDIIEEQSITDASHLWNVEEAYFLSHDKNEIILREDREVFYLSGLDFSDPEIIENAKIQLQID